MVIADRGKNKGVTSGWRNKMKDRDSNKKRQALSKNRSKTSSSASARS